MAGPCAQWLAELLCRTYEYPLPSPMLLPSILDMVACTETKVPKGQDISNGHGDTHGKVLAAVDDSTPMAGRTICRYACQRDPRQEPDALARMSGSVRGARGNPGPYLAKPD